MLLVLVLALGKRIGHDVGNGARDRDRLLSQKGVLDGVEDVHAEGLVEAATRHVRMLSVSIAARKGAR